MIIVTPRQIEIFPWKVKRIEIDRALHFLEGYTRLWRNLVIWINFFSHLYIDLSRNQAFCNRTVQYSKVLWSTVQWSTVQYCTVQPQFWPVQLYLSSWNQACCNRTVQYSKVMWSSVQYSEVQYSTASILTGLGYKQSGIKPGWSILQLY